MATKTMKPETVVDKLGELKAEISKLKKKEDALRCQLIGSGLHEIDGKLYRATVSDAEVRSIDYQGLLAELKVPARTIMKYTRTSQRTTVKVVARKTN